MTLIVEITQFDISCLNKVSITNCIILITSGISFFFIVEEDRIMNLQTDQRVTKNIDKNISYDLLYYNFLLIKKTTIH